MKKILMTLGMAMSVLCVFSQNRENEKVALKYVQLPLKPVVDARSYNCKLDASSFAGPDSALLYQYGLSENYVKGLLRLQGLTYANDNADVTLTLVAAPLKVISHEIVNVAKEGETPSYKAIYLVGADWKINVSGKATDLIEVNENNGNVEVRFPSESYLLNNSADATSRELIEQAIKANGAKIEKAILRQAYNATTAKTQSLIRSNFSYQPVNKSFELCSFKTNKKFDASKWEQITPGVIESLKGLTNGQAPQAVYGKCKEAIDFWQAQFDEKKGDLKTNDKIVEAAVKNLITVLSLTNPSQLKDEYATVLEKVAYFDSETILPWMNQMKKRNDANQQSIDYNVVGNNAALGTDSYEAFITTKAGEKFAGIIVLKEPYYYNPYLLAFDFKLYKLTDYINAMGSPSGKVEIDNKTVASYALLGKTFESVKYSDPSVVSLSGSEEFMERICDGVAPLFKTYTLELADEIEKAGEVLTQQATEEDYINARKHPRFFLQINGKKPTLVMNYTKLAELMADCPAVADKIKSGAYGNEPVKEKSSKFGAMLAKGAVKEITEDVIVKIVTDYNSLKK